MKQTTRKSTSMTKLFLFGSVGVAILLFALMMAAQATKKHRVGGIGNEKPASEAPPKFREALESMIKQQFTEASGYKPKQFELVSFATQIVAGTNYFAKVKIGDNEYAHIRVFEPLPYRSEPMHLHSYQRSKGLGDPIEYFQKNSD